MDCVTPIFEFLSNRSRDLFALLFGHIVSLEGNIYSLKREMRELQSLRDDVKRQVDAAERQRLTCTNQVRWWLESVDNLGSEVGSIDVEFERLFRCFGDCRLNIGSRYWLGKRAAEKLAEVRDLKGKGVFSKVADGFLLGKIEEVPITSSVGVNLLLEQLHCCVTGVELDIIGLHGMGGVGKTNLLKKFNNELLSLTHDFDIVILLEVTRDLNVDRLQRAIGSRLGLRWQENEDPKERATHIFAVLSTLNFVIFLDDIWEPLYLPSIGIPIPNSQHRRKIVFSTRIEDVCINMDAQKIIKVECLPWEEAWNLFVQKIGKEFIVSQPELEMFAKAIVKKCGGLPLALTTMGRTMASKRALDEWEHAFMTMVNAPWEIPGLKELVLDCLRSSYDNLATDKLRQCFLYCSLYPEEFSIEKVWLIDYWMCEGILGDMGYVTDACRKGHEILNLLKASCLLDDDSGRVRMHCMMRNLALWIASECGQQKNKWLVQAGVLLKRPPETERWKEAERISLMDNEISTLPEAPICPNLISLMLHHNSALHKFSDGFFLFMPSLTILELSITSIEELPPAIGMLRELRYLNLWQTKLISLPKELGYLANLKYLELGWTPTLRFIPKGLIAKLSPSLQMLGMFNTRIDWKVDGSSEDGASFEELEGLQKLKSLGISFGNVSTLQRLSSFHRLASSTVRLHVFGCEGMTTIILPSTLGENITAINMLTISDSNELQEVIIGTENEECSLMNLQILEIRNLAKAKLVCRVLLPQQGLGSLRFLWITSCSGIEQLIDGVTFAFARLEELHLADLPKLKSICWDIAIIFPSLQFLKVDKCPKLKRLPFGSSSDNYKITAIGGQSEWWDTLEWQDDIIKSSFQPLFKELKRSDSAFHAVDGGFLNRDGSPL
uniref:Disease resistance protein RPS2 n=1 Tax=Anthurium amnicola TaxID=1678845 RepID=A0A1D1YYI6_9ARAE